MQMALGASRAAALISPAALMLLALGALATTRPTIPRVRASVLDESDTAELRGPVVGAGLAALGDFPRPWDAPTAHPALSSVQYMPADSTEWYPDQEGGQEAEDVEEDAEPESDSGTADYEEDEDANTAETADRAEEEDAPTAERAGMQMLAARRIPDPSEWLQHKVGAGVEGTMKQLVGGSGLTSAAQSGSAGQRRVLDPVEWMEEKYLKHTHGDKVLARHPSSWRGTEHAQRQQLRSRGGYPIVSTMLAQQGFWSLKKHRGARASGRRSFKTMQQRDQLWWQRQARKQMHRNSAGAADDGFLLASQHVHAARLLLFGDQASAADDDILKSASKHVDSRPAHTVVGMTSARRGPALITW